MNQRFSPRRVALSCGLFVLAAAAVFVSPSSSGQGRAKLQQDVGQALSSHDELTLDPSAVVRQVQETGRLSLQTSRGTFDLELEPYDVRAANYRGVAMEDGGVVRDLGRAPSRTFKGTVRGMEGAQARFSIDGQVFEGLIATPGGEVYFVESAKSFSAAAGKGDFVFYPLSAVKAESFGECGTTLAHRVGERAAAVAGGGLRVAGGEVSLPVSELTGKARFYEYQAASGKTVRFFAMKGSDGVYRAALDACDVCFAAKKGYRQEGDDMVCNNCGNHFHSAQVNEVKGGCNPVGLERKVSGDRLSLSAKELEDGASYF